jgi:RNA-directed DNA polymerase
MKPPNKAGEPATEVVEGRGPAEGNPNQQNVPRTQCRTSTPSALERIREAAKKDRKVKFTALLHHITIERLRVAFNDLSKNAASGVDGVKWEQYAEGLEGNLQDLHRRLHRGAYRAKPSRRAYIPKADGSKRPLGHQVCR